MKNIIITCGTSILNWKIIDNQKLKERIDEIEKHDNNDLNDKFIKYFSDENYKKLESTKKIKNYWVEINLLNKIYEKWDNIFLFFSQTKWWELVKEILKWYLKTQYAKKLFHDDNLKIEDHNYITIDGFKVDDKNSFKDTAIKSFYSKLDEIKQNWYDETIMCPVWWYKALIPYASLYAMVNGWDIKYIYEDSDELMDLPSGALSYFVYQNMIWKNVKLDEWLSKKSNYNLETILELSNFIHNFKNFWYINNLDKISTIFLENNPDFKRSLLLLKNTIDFVWINNSDLKNIKDNLKWLTNKLKKTDDIENMFLNDMISDIKDNFLDSTIDWRFMIINWYLWKNRILESFLILRELFLDIFSYYIFWEIKLKENNIKKVDYRWLLETQSYLFFNPNLKDHNKKYLEDELSITPDEKNKICELYNLVSNYKKNDLLKKAYDKSKDVRNILAHIWKQNKEFYKELSNINNYIEVLESFKNQILNK